MPSLDAHRSEPRETGNEDADPAATRPNCLTGGIGVESREFHAFGDNPYYVPRMEPPKACARIVFYDHPSRPRRII